VPQQWRVDLGQLIIERQDTDWAHKRIENFERLAPWVQCPPNVWLGVTTKNQEYFDQRWPILARIAAVVRFVSNEPKLGPLTLAEYDLLPDWIICGGESGGNARMMDPDCARQLRDECLDRGVFMKQMTRKKPIPPDLLIRQSPLPKPL
jgi:protein gp37